MIKDIILTEEGKYSYTKRRDGEITIDFLKKHIGSLIDLSILDATANVGGDTILFGLNFKHVSSIEINDTNFNALKHNVSLYKFDNVDIYKGDSTSLFDNYVSDIVYFDPPWGGPDYKTKKELDLYIGDKRIDLFIKNDLLSRTASYRPKYIMLKLPFNYNWTRLKLIDDIEKTFILKIRNYRILLIKLKDFVESDDSKESETKTIEHVVNTLIEESNTFTLFVKNTNKKSRSGSRSHTRF
jgi:predicted RNA methylase